MKPIIIIVGDASVGKTEFGKRLAKSLRAALIDIDAGTEPLVRRGLTGYGMNPDDRDSPKYKELFRDSIHDCLFSAARIQQIPVVLVAPLTKERIQGDAFFQWLEIQMNGDGHNDEQGKKIEERYQNNNRECEIFVIHLYCNHEEKMRRMLERKNPRDASKFVFDNKETASYKFEESYLQRCDTEKTKEWLENEVFRKWKEMGKWRLIDVSSRNELPSTDGPWMMKVE